MRVLSEGGGLKRGLLGMKHDVLPAKTGAVRRCAVLAALAFFAFSFFLASALGESCRTSGDMDDATRTALTTTGLRYFDLIVRGDSAALRQNSIPSLAKGFSAIESAVNENQTELAGAKALARPPFLLEADGTVPIAHAEFLCGVFDRKGQTSDSAVFSFNNLSPGKYGVVILEASASKGAYFVSLLVQQQAADWKLAGLYIKAAQLSRHDGDWFIRRAHEFQSKGQQHNAWLYTLVARSLVSPLAFMSTAETDTLYDDSQKLQPADFPADGKTVDFYSVPSRSPEAAKAPRSPASTYRLTEIFPQLVGGDLDLTVKYEAADISNTTQTYQSNVAVMKALLAKFPELRDAFAAINARAVDASGRDYGTLLSMKDIK